MMSIRHIFLMGAPTAQSLHWNEDDLLNAPVAPFETQDGQAGDIYSFQDPQPVKWRLVKNRQPLGGYDGTALDLGNGTLFLTSQDFVNLNGPSTPLQKDSDLTQFYNHSYTVHETSEISTHGGHAGDSMQESSLWTDSMGTSLATSSGQEGSRTCPIPIQGCLTDIRDIPSARYLQSIVPQTMTVNLIVSIITIHPPRRIVTRQWHKELDIVELVVGDETRTGFGVTFWLPSSSDPTGRNNEDELRKSLAELRPRDIVLLRMVGLSSFRERVYGQSLRRGVTKVDLLHRQRVDASDAGGVYGLRSLKKNAAKEEDLPLLKVRRVREWIMRFVGWTTDIEGGGDEGGRMCQRGRALPPDTQ